LDNLEIANLGITFLSYEIRVGTLHVLLQIHAEPNSSRTGLANLPRSVKGGVKLDH
jgi:hypothetical protein